MSERLTSSTEGPMLVAPREVLVCFVLPWSFPARVSCPMLRFMCVPFVSRLLSVSFYRSCTVQGEGSMSCSMNYSMAAAVARSHVRL